MVWKPCAAIRHRWLWAYDGMENASTWPDTSDPDVRQYLDQACRHGFHWAYESRGLVNWYDLICRHCRRVRVKPLNLWLRVQYFE